MAKTTHPHYVNSTIQEALVEIRFQQPLGNAEVSEFFGEFFKRIVEEFPKIEPIMSMEVQSGVGQQVVQQNVIRQRFRFTHASRPLVLQLTENVFSVNVLQTYPGWEVMREDVAKAWENVVAVLQPELITQVTLRYINRIALTEAQQPVSYWLTANDFLPVSVVRSVPPYFARVEARSDNQNSNVVTLAYLPPTGLDPAEPHGATIFDIERVMVRSMSTQVDQLLNEVDRLHEDVWQVFDSAKKDTLEQLLKGG